MAFTEPSGKDGFFRLTSRNRESVARYVYTRLAADEAANPPARTAVDIGDFASPLTDAMLDKPFRTNAQCAQRDGKGDGARQVVSREWHPSFFWRFTCALVSLAIFALCALAIYTTHRVTVRVNDALANIDTLHPGLIRDTVDDAQHILHGAAVASTEVGALLQATAPAMHNMSTAAASVLAQLSNLAENPIVQIALGGRGVRPR
jgi:hypothetical protein